MFFPKPTQESEYFNGIIRSLKVHVSATSDALKYPKNKYAVLQNSVDYYWHSYASSFFGCYLEIEFPCNNAIVTSYLISSGNNGDYYLISWDLNCSMNGNDWTIIDSHKDETTFTASKQIKIYDVKIQKRCNKFRFVMNSVESMGRQFMYLGPIELYGSAYNNSLTITQAKCKGKSSIIYFIIYLFVC